MNHGTEAKMVARRLRLLNSDQNEALLRGFVLARRFRSHQDDLGRILRLTVRANGVTAYFSLRRARRARQASWGFRR